MFVYGPHGQYSETETETDSEDDPENMLMRRREECERKARRGEMDPRLEFTFQLLMDATGLPRNEIMDHVFEGDMLDEINQLFLPHMRTKLMWFYQEMEDTELQTVVDINKPSTSRQLQPSTSRANLIQQLVPTYKKKLFLTDGWNVALTGICVYIFRTNTSKQLPEEGFQKDLFCGIIDAKRIGLVTTVERIIEHVFMEALAHPSPDCEDDAANCPMVKNQLLPGLRSFCSALKVCEEVCNEGNLFDDGKSAMSIYDEHDVKDLSKHPEKVAELEGRVKGWCKRLAEILKESEQIRRENDSSGPQDELEYWKKRGAQFSQISTQVNSSEVQMTILCLQMAHSKNLKEWRETDKKITFCYNEAKDNAKFIQALEKNCHSLYLDDPVKMKDSILGLLQTVRLIHSVSQFYNTSERTSALMVKITNQMIETCKEYITCRGQESIWSQDRAVVKDKLTQCIKLNKVYRKTYTVVKNQPFLPGQRFNFSENYVFGKFDAFCRRLSKIISTFDLIDDYSGLFQRRMEGLLLGDALEEAVQNFNEIKAIVMDKSYDYLDQRNSEFENDFKNFLAHTDELKENIGEMIERNFDSVWETPQGIRFLTRFEKVSEKIPLTRMDDKYERILKYCEKEVDRIIKMYKKQKDDPPVPRMFPPIAGRIKWARTLVAHLDELLNSVTSHHILKNLPATVELSKRHKAAQNTLKSYEADMVALWMNQHVWDVDRCLERYLIAVCPEQQRLKVNIHNTIPLLIREADLMIKMDLPVPMVALTLYAKHEHFSLVQDSLQFLINDFLSIVKSVKLEVRPLFLPHLVTLTNKIAPGLHELTWVSHEWKEFVDNGNESIQKFKILADRVHDVYTNRVIEVINSMQSVQLHALPEVGEDPWRVDFFCDKIDNACRSAATELHRKSLMVEEAVEEILVLVRKARVDPLAPEEDIFMEDEERLTDVESTSTQQQSDWTLVWECFEKPHLLLSGGMAKAMQDVVHGAVNEMRRYYSRKIIDVLVRVTRQSLDALRRRFASEYQNERTPVFVLNSILLIPKVSIQPNLDEVQDVLVLAGKNITSVSKGVGQWTGGKSQVQEFSTDSLVYFTLYIKHLLR